MTQGFAVADGQQSTVAELLRNLPGVGASTAGRYLSRLLSDLDYAQKLGVALTGLAGAVRPCGQCGDHAEAELCEVCSHPRRSQDIVCVVEDHTAVEAIIAAGWPGVFHVLGGCVDPIEGRTLVSLNWATLAGRLRSGSVHELVVMTGYSPCGEKTAHEIATEVERMTSPVVKVARPSPGVPVGADVGLSDSMTLARALGARQPI